ncbi:MAG: TrkA family potassium uptake protein [Limnochordia bacterium]|nr:TrkA family potassium uptake protein [Limnochordia bacterium]MDD4517226.1 TrkA family potassium uptake protein [Limnochordia bacterium]
MRRRIFAVLGLGRFGSSVARELSEIGYEVVAVDKDSERVQDVADVVVQAVQADTTDERALEKMGIKNVDVAIVSIGQDVQASILTTLQLKSMGVKKVWAKAQNELHGRVLEKVGADRVVYPERDMGVRVAHSLVSVNLLDYIEVAPDYSIAETIVPQRFANKTLGEIDLRKNYGINVLVVKRGEGLNISPGATDMLMEGDVLIVIGPRNQLDRLQVD